MKWITKIYNYNANTIEDYDLFHGNNWVDLIKKSKKICNNKEEFSRRLRMSLMSMYWSRCEYELIIEKKDGRIILYPWAGSRDIDAATIDVTDDTSFDWAGFAEKHINKQVTKNSAKIDIFNQIDYQWDEFINYCLTAKIPHDRNAGKWVEQGEPHAET